MSSPFVGEIRMVPFNFAPRGWAFCNGSLLSISQNPALFSLLGTFYGGDAKVNFALPNLQGMMAVHTDQYSGAGQYPLGAVLGSETVTLLSSGMPSHGHTVNVATVAERIAIPGASNFLGPTGRGSAPAYSTTSNTQTGAVLGIAGSSVPHNNMMPYLTLNFIIALQGIYPPRT